MTITKSVSINILQIFYQDGGEEDDREMDAPEIKITLKLDLTKDAGFVYESLRIETN